MACEKKDHGFVFGLTIGQKKKKENRKKVALKVEECKGREKRMSAYANNKLRVDREAMVFRECHKKKSNLYDRA